MFILFIIWHKSNWVYNKATLWHYVTPEIMINIEKDRNKRAVRFPKLVKSRVSLLQEAKLHYIMDDLQKTPSETIRELIQEYIKFYEKKNWAIRTEQLQINF